MGKKATSNQVDDEIYKCLNLDSPKSFFLFAGAGSGKTKSLVDALKRFRDENITHLRRNAQKIAVITYTNAACDEIKSRLEFDSAFHVSTIHSFAWDLIQPYTSDIKEWLKQNLQSEISELEALQEKAKNTNTKTYLDRINKIAAKTRRFESMKSTKKFTYNPNGDNLSKDSLNHSEVINIAADFIKSQPLMQRILVHKYPILLIDESQDTKKELIESFFEVQKKKPEYFTLGMFGDTMQRIYNDGKVDLGQNIPSAWAKPVKTINYRCPKRITTLINKIRSGADQQTQVADKESEGIVRMFVVNTKETVDKARIESEIFSLMSAFSHDSKWEGPDADVKILTLEHHMAAQRAGFSAFFNPLYAVDKLRTGLIDGTLPGSSFFANQILPLIKAKQNNDDFTVARIARKHSPLVSKELLRNSSNSTEDIGKAKTAVDSLFTLWDNNQDPSLNDILTKTFQSGIFQIPDSLMPIAKRLSENQNNTLEDNETSDRDVIIDAWDEAMQCSFSKFEEYVRYISDKSRFGTHQGIKGLQFPRVMVILDDEEARGFLFSYEKLFGAKEPSETDIKNQQEGKETAVERTLRLFYVTCSRAEESLAIVAYTKEPKKVKKYIIKEGWFSEHEVIEF